MSRLASELLVVAPNGECLLTLEISLTEISRRKNFVEQLTDLARNQDVVVLKFSETGALLGSAQEWSLDSFLATLSETGLALNIGRPRIKYLETIRHSIREEYTHKALKGGHGEYARVILEISPDERGTGCWFENHATNEKISEQFISGIKEGVRSVLLNGTSDQAVGFTDIKVSLIECEFHHEDSQKLHFEIAARAALRQAIEVSQRILLEPIMLLQISTQVSHSGKIIQDIISRRGVVLSATLEKDTQVIDANVPLANLFGYDSVLKQLSFGNAKMRMVFSHYKAVVTQPSDDPNLFPLAIGMRA
jgi:elongation factor G